MSRDTKKFSRSENIPSRLRTQTVPEILSLEIFQLIWDVSNFSGSLTFPRYGTISTNVLTLQRHQKHLYVWFGRVLLFICFFVQIWKVIWSRAMNISPDQKKRYHSEPNRMVPLSLYLQVLLWAIQLGLGQAIFVVFFLVNTIPIGSICMVCLPTFTVKIN